MLIAKWAGKANRLKSVVSWNLVLGSQNQVGGGAPFQRWLCNPGEEELCQQLSRFLKFGSYGSERFTNTLDVAEAREKFLF